MNTLEASRALNVLQDRILKEAVGEEEYVKARAAAKREITDTLYGGLDVTYYDQPAKKKSEPFFGDALMDGIEYDSDGKPRPAGLVVDRTVPISDELFGFPGLEPPVG